MRAATKAVGQVADRLLGLVAPHTTARAAECEWECCDGGLARFCCFSLGGGLRCTSCIAHGC
jgi:hypothetical protein